MMTDVVWFNFQACNAVFQLHCNICDDTHKLRKFGYVHYTPIQLTSLCHFIHVGISVRLLTCFMLTIIPNIDPNIIVNFCFQQPLRLNT